MGQRTALFLAVLFWVLCAVWLLVNTTLDMDRARACRMLGYETFSFTDETGYCLKVEDGVWEGRPLTFLLKKGAE